MSVSTINDCRWRAMVALRVEAELESLPDVRILRRTTVFGGFDQRNYGAVERVADHLATPDEYMPRQRLWRITAKQTVLAGGSIERPLVFGDNDRPGIMLAGAVRTYLNRFSVYAGERAVIFATNDDAARTVDDLACPASRSLPSSIRGRNPRRHDRRRQSAPVRSCSQMPWSCARLAAATACRRLRSKGRTANRTIDCDLIAMSGGWNPSLHLTSHLGHKPVWNEQIAAFVPDKLPDGMRVAGAARGHSRLRVRSPTGRDAGVAAAESCRL